MRSCLLLGCHVEPLDAAALRGTFPEQADEILGGRFPLVPSGDGFVRASDPVSSEVRAFLPARGEEPLRFALQSGAEVAVRELGAAGEGAPAEGAVAFERAGGASFWSATEAGYEEWLWLEPGVARRDAPVATWEITGAALRERGAAVEIASEDGAAQMEVTAPLAFAAGGRPVITRLAARGARMELWVDADGEAVLVDPGWKSLAGGMNEARRNHAATAVSDAGGNERVLVTGGVDANDAVLPGAEWFDPVAGTWATLPPMNVAREQHTATLLGDGTVLVAGGDAQGTSQVFDPKTGTWSPAQPMLAARSGHTATAVKDSSGNELVLVAGGDAQGTSETFDPSSGTWTHLLPMSTARSGHTATLLPNGTVLVTGGADGDQVLATSELFDPDTMIWSMTASMSAARSNHTATLLPDGTVIAAGGADGDQVLATSELFDPASATWAAGPEMSVHRAYHTATLLQDGSVLVAGGTTDLTSAVVGAEVFDTASCWHLVGPLRVARETYTATLLRDGRVLAAGGGPESLSSAELFSAVSAGWSPVAPMSYTRINHAAALLEDGRTLVTGGQGLGVDPEGKERTAPLGPRSVGGPQPQLDANGGPLASVEVFDPTTQQWVLLAPLQRPRFGHSATLLPDGRVLVAGGCDNGTLASVEVFDPVAQTWTTIAPMTHPREGHTATLLLDGRVLVVGGHGGGIAFKDAELFDPVAGTWTPIAKQMSVARDGHTATLLPNGQVLVAGGGGPGMEPSATAELFDPASQAWAPAGTMNDARRWHTAALLPNGNVLVAGGLFSDGITVLGTAEIFAADADAGASWSPTTSMTSARLGHTATPLTDGDVLIAGGVSSYDGIDVEDTPALVTAELFGAVTQTWASAGSMSAPRVGHTATLGADGTVLVAGGPGNTADLFGLVAEGTSCLSNQDCQSSHCVEGVCCDQACAGEGCETCLKSEGAVADGTCTPLHPECTPFICFVNTMGAAMCAKPCMTVQDCAPGFACDNSGDCVKPPPEGGYRDDGGCALSSPGVPAPAGIGLMFLAALAFARRSRR